jgi:hypothetical protein
MPNIRDVVVDVTLTNYVRDYRWERQTFVADVVAPVIPVTSFKGRYKALGKELANIDVADHGSDKGETNQIDYDVSEVTFDCIERRLKIFVSQKEINQSPSGLEPLQRAALAVTHGLKLRQERRIVDLADNTSNTAAAAAVWSSATLAQFLADNRAAIAAYKLKAGMPPNLLVIPDHGADGIMMNSALFAAVYTAASLGGDTPPEILGMAHGQALPKRLFNCNVVVPTCMYNSAEPIQPNTPTIARVWGNDAYYFGASPVGEGPTWGAQFRSLGFTIVRFPREDPAGWWVKAVHETDEVETTGDSIYRITAVIS